MSDPSRVQGPIGPIDPAAVKKDKTIGPDDFKKYMVEETSATDADKRRHRKRREEHTEETEEEKKAIVSSPKLKSRGSKQEKFPLAAQSGSPTQFTPPKTHPTPPQKTSPIAPFAAEDIEKFAWEDEAKAQAPSLSESALPPPPKSEPVFSLQEPVPVEPLEPTSSNLPSDRVVSYQDTFAAPTLPKPSTSSVAMPRSSETPPEREKEKYKEKEIEPSKKTRPENTKKIAKQPHLLSKLEKKPKKLSEDFKSLMEEPEVAESKKTSPKLKREKSPSENLEQAPFPPPEENKPFLSGALLSQKKEEIVKLAPKKLEEELRKETAEEISSEAFSVLPSAETKQGESGEKKKDKEEPQIPATSPLIEEGRIAPFPIQEGVPLLTSVSPYADLPADMLALIERLVGAVTIMKTIGITETVLTLNDKSFGGTPLMGTTITIRDYQFAAGKLNLEFAGTPAAMALLQHHLPSLLAALHKAGLSVERKDFIFQRKESVKRRNRSPQKVTKKLDLSDD